MLEDETTVSIPNSSIQQKYPIAKPEAIPTWYNIYMAYGDEEMGR